MEIRSVGVFSILRYLGRSIANRPVSVYELDSVLSEWNNFAVKDDLYSNIAFRTGMRFFSSTALCIYWRRPGHYFCSGLATVPGWKLLTNELAEKKISDSNLGKMFSLEDLSVDQVAIVLEAFWVNIWIEMERVRIFKSIPFEEY